MLNKVTYRPATGAAAVVLLVLGAVVVLACRRGSEVPQASSPGLVDSLECPNHNVGIPGGDTILPIAGVTTTIAEFHDCQRLVDQQQSDAYTVLAGVWVSEVLTGLVDSLIRLNPWVDSAHKADTLTGARPQATPMGEGLTFALVYAWDGDYAPLGIVQGWNCLRVFPSSHPSIHRFAARMEPASDPENCVGPRMDAETRGQDLVVHDHTMTGFTGADYPAVGRWEWDIEHKDQYISLKCGDAWCDVTRADSYVASPDYRLPPGDAKGRRRVFEVKGWYDEQRLAVGKPGALRPASIQGTIFPDPGLDGIDSTGAFAGTWVPAAQLGLKGPLPAYQQKFDMDPGQYPPSGPGNSGPFRLNQLYLCLDRGGGCEGVPPDLSCDPDTKGDTWYARMDPSQMNQPGPGPTQPAYFCVTRHDHSGLGRHIPGTARWRWVKEDEKLWVKCAAGCCTVN